MNTLSPKIARKFKPVFSVPEYQTFMRKYRWRDLPWMLDNKPGSKEEYWDRLPEYVLSVCPICGTEHTDWLDLHSFVMGWGANSDTVNVGHVHRSSIYQSCKHHVAMPTFINLNGLIPNENVGLESEVPFLSPYMFPDEIKESYAVINAFPLCRVESDQFVPAYTAFVIKYYGDNPRVLRNANHLPWRGDSRPPILYHVNEAWEHRADKVFDLQYWVERGRLFWIEEEDGRSILKNNASEFPYRDIEGIVERMRFTNGKREIIGHDNPPRYFPTWPPDQWTKKQHEALKPKLDKGPLPGCKYVSAAFLIFPFVAMVTSIFFWQIFDPLFAWLLLLAGVTFAGFLIIYSSVKTFKEEKISRRAFIYQLISDLALLLLSTGAAIISGGMAAKYVGQWVLGISQQAWLAVVVGMLAAFVAGFGAGTLVREAWKRIVKPLSVYIKQ